ncbi:MAG: IS3 family transposase [Eubacteriales bacterium]|nr:IS3 family transposase [Eubacteriales bacterium]
MRFSDIQKKELVALYYGGGTVSDICLQSGVPRSTFYTWLKPYQTEVTPSGNIVSANEFVKMKQRLEKLEQKIEVLQKVDCTVSSPLQDNLQELSKLSGQYSVHILCDALCVARGTFYNHIFRRKEVTVYDKRREEMREHIQTVFDESRQRFGANKIAAVLSERGIKTTPKYVAELMREMGIESIVINSKKEYKRHLRLAKRQNHLQRHFQASEPNRFWVSDVTCFKINDKYYYVCMILDLFSRKIVAHGMSTKNSTYLITSAFKRAFKERGNPQLLMT